MSRKGNTGGRWFESTPRHQLEIGMETSFSFNGFVIPYWKELDSEQLVVKFKNTSNWVNIDKMIAEQGFIYRPDLTVYQLLITMTETSNENVGFWDHSEKKPGSKSFLRRLIENGGVRFNGRILKPSDKLDFPVFSIVVFPKSETHYITLW